MAAAKTRVSSFSRSVSTGSSAQNRTIKSDPGGTFFVSSGIPDLDKILGGGFAIGSFVVVMEDAEAPHHMLLLRNFMSQGLVHCQPLLYGTPLPDPGGFLGTLPSPAAPVDKGRTREQEEEKGLRIAWQYKKYFAENNLAYTGGNAEYSNEFDLRKPLERHYFSNASIDCLSFNSYPDLIGVRERCESFFTKYLRDDTNKNPTCRIVLQSLCAPQCGHSNKEWETLFFLRWLKTTIQSSNAVAIVSFPPALLSPTTCKRLQHMADVLLSVGAIPDDDKELAKLLTGYQDMVGFLNVHQANRTNSQVPVIPEATTFSIKLRKRRHLVLECLNQAPVDGSGGSGCSSSSSSSQNKLDF